MNNHNADDASRDRLLGRITALLWVVVIALAVIFFYFASSFWITLLLAGFLVILVEPLVALLERLHLPRSASAALVVVLGMILVSATIYAFYNKAADFVDTLPQYTSKIRKAIDPAVKRLERMQDSAGNLNPTPAPEKVPEVRVSEPPRWPSYLARGVGSVAGAIVIAAVVPFLMFFMLVRKDHIYSWVCGRELRGGLCDGGRYRCSLAGDWDARGRCAGNRKRLPQLDTIPGHRFGEHCSAASGHSPIQQCQDRS